MIKNIANKIIMGFINRNNAVLVEYNTSNIGGNNFRYYLLIDNIKNPQREAIVIMKNPSGTCDNMTLSPNGIVRSYSDKKKCHIDRTTGIVYRYLKKCGYERVIILNLFPLFNKNTMLVKNFYNRNINAGATLQQNNNIIRSALLQYGNADVICAWGQKSNIGSRLYDTIITTIIQIIGNRNLLCYSRGNGLVNYAYSNDNKYPPHGLCWK